MSAMGAAKMAARPTLYKGIQMRSRLEAGFAQWLDGLEVGWEYEPFAMAAEEGQWLPDFLLPGLADYTIMARRDVFIEVKPKSWFVEHTAARDLLDKLRRWQRIVEASRPGALFLLATMNGHDYPILMGDRQNFRIGFAWQEPPLPMLSYAPLMQAPLPWRGEWWKGDADCGEEQP